MKAVCGVGVAGVIAGGLVRATCSNRRSSGAVPVLAVRSTQLLLGIAAWNSPENKANVDGDRRPVWWMSQWRCLYASQTLLPYGRPATA